MCQPCRIKPRIVQWTTCLVRHQLFYCIQTLQTSLTADKYRVVLKQGHPDYINASFVNVSLTVSFIRQLVNYCLLSLVHFQSYKHKRAFIVTQNPMENTSGDFWKMVVERDCRAIVMLNPLEENGQVS